jgi:hypothetical protein
MSQEKESKNPRVKFQRRAIWFFISALIAFLAFNYGYVKGFVNVRTGVFSPIFQLHKKYLLPELDNASVVRVLPVTYSQYGILEELDLQIIYPHTWAMTSRIQEENLQNFLENELIYELRDMDSRATLKIELLNVDFSRAVVAASTDVTFSLQILDREVVTYDIPELGEESFITVYREPESDVKVSYVQAIKSQVSPSEEPKRLENFIIFNHKYGKKENSNILLTAKITLEFDENLTEEEKERLLEITDNIVASLRLL